MLPALCDDQRFILGLVSGAASVIFGLVMIDVGPSTLGTLEALSDRVTSVSKLADEGVRELFLRL